MTAHQPPKPPNGTAPPAAPRPPSAANAAAAGTAGKGLATGLAGWFGSLAARAAPVGEQLASAAKGLQAKAAGVKFPSMPVDVKVDFLRPTADAVREAVRDVWVQLPPPVQQAAPYAGAALASGIVVFAIQQHRLKNERKKSQELIIDLERLRKERANLVLQIRELHTKPRTDVELRMSAAVADATNAAAAAAEAAAHAATASSACIIQLRQREAHPAHHHSPPFQPPPSAE